MGGGGWPAAEDLLHLERCPGDRGVKERSSRAEVRAAAAAGEGLSRCPSGEARDQAECSWPASTDGGHNDHPARGQAA